MVLDLSAFRLGDIRGIYPETIDERFVSDFAHAFVGRFDITGKVVTGRDMRESSESLQSALNATLSSIGVDVVDIGLCPTELGYFASGVDDIGAAIIVTASHNPAAYSGLKCVLKGGLAITYDNGLGDVKDRMAASYRHPAAAGSVVREDFHSRYLEFLRGHFVPESLGGGQVALNGLNGTAGPMAGMIASEFDLPVTWFRKHPGPFPEQGADPANPDLAAEMKSFMAGQSFAMGIAWDGDCDRCVCFDARGDLIPTYYVVGLMIDRFLRRQPGAAIVFDTKLCWNTLDMINRHGGVPVPAATGHAFMKQKMQQHGAVYGGELSSHHYFGDFNGCDSGMFAWLTVTAMLNESEAELHEVVQARKRVVCSTPEISLALNDVDDAFAEIETLYQATAVDVDHFDGLSFSMPGDWRFSLRRSKTEAFVRVNFEGRRCPDTMMGEGRKVLEHLERFRRDDTDWYKGFVPQ